MCSYELQNLTYPFKGPFQRGFYVVDNYGRVYWKSVCVCACLHDWQMHRNVIVQLTTNPLNRFSILFPLMCTKFCEFPQATHAFALKKLIWNVYGLTIFCSNLNFCDYFYIFKKKSKFYIYLLLWNLEQKSPNCLLVQRTAQFGKPAHLQLNTYEKYRSNPAYNYLFNYYNFFFVGKSGQKFKSWAGKHSIAQSMISTSSYTQD